VDTPITLYILAGYMREGLGLPGPASGSGGVFTQMAVLARTLAKRPDYRVVLLTDEQFEYPGMDVRVVPPAPKGTGIPLVDRVRKRLYRERVQKLMKDEGPRAILFPHLVRSTQITAAQREGVKTILWINADQLVDDSPIGRSQPATTYVHRAIPRVDAVGVLSDRQQRFVREKWGIEATILTSGIEPPDPELCKIPQDGALWVGRLAPGKRPWVFIDLARKNPNHRFRVVMRTRAIGSTAFEDYVDGEAVRYPNLEIVRDVPAQEMSRMYAGSRALIVTSASEGFSRVMAEAGATGTEVLSLEINVDGLLDGERWGYCAGGDYDAFEGKVTEVLDGPLPTTEERLAIRQDLLARYGADRMADDVDRLVRSLL
jgi:glycosyltransferase involved in cell wall biosynthesis